MNSCWKNTKIFAWKTQAYIGLTIHLCQILNMAVILILPMYALYLDTKGYSRTITKKINVGYCCVADYKALMGKLYITLISFPEVCISLFIASSSMICMLYRHKQRIQHIHVISVSLKSPASRATKKILVLVSTFISFYTLSSIFRIYITSSHDHSSWFISISELTSLCFPTTSPFLIMGQDFSVFVHCISCARNTKAL